jgi:shikimate 5-dehydrogenase/shikimate kinase
MTLLEFSSWPVVRSFDPNASIVLVGSRGAGKRSLGFIAATKLGRRFITEDHYFVSITGVSRGEYIQKHGNAKFYAQNVEVLQHMLFQNRMGCVIECGMGSLAREAQDLLREYAKLNPVIYILRNSSRIGKLLKLDERDAARLEEADLTHRYCSNLEFYNLYDPTCEDPGADTSEGHDRGSPGYSFKLKNAKQDFSSFVDIFAGGQAYLPICDNPFSITAIPAEKRPFTYALNVRLSDFLQGRLDLDELELDSCGDVVELRIDVQPQKSLKDIAKLAALVRRKLGVPLMLDVVPQVKKEIGEDQYFQLLYYALRLGIDYLVVDLSYDRESIIPRLMESRGRTKIVGDYFDTRQKSKPWSDGFLLRYYMEGIRLGCDIVRISRVATKGDANEDPEWLRRQAKKLPKSGPLPILIAYNLGPLGHSSQVDNQTFTPVSAVMLSDLGGIIKRDPESLTAQEAMRTLGKRNIIDPLHFYLVGESVFYSLSPAIHSEAYRVCGMRHDYQLHQTSSLEDLQRLSEDFYFGGASISQPFKVGIVSELKAMSKHASAIGAINTILPIKFFPDGIIPDGSMESLMDQAKRRGRAGQIMGWYGDNTDWIGMTRCLQRNISPINTIRRTTTALVIGAGGMARATIYAITQLGCRKVYICNRSHDRAQNVAEHFNSQRTGSPEADMDPIVKVLNSTSDP